MRQPLNIPPGLFTDDTSLAAAGRWGDGSNVRFWEDLPQVIGGWESVTSDLLTGVCRAAFNWTDNLGSLNIAFGTNSKLQVWVGGGLYDITPASGFTVGAVDGAGGSGFGTGTFSTGNFSEPSTADFFPLTWSLSAWGENLIASPRGQTIFLWANNTGTKAAAVTNAPAKVTYSLVAPQDQIFALGCNQEVGGVFNPLCIRHSGVRNATEWNTAPSTTAREYVLPGGGRIVAGRVIGRYLLVWTSHSLFLGTYVGQSGQVWRFDRVGEKCGLIGPNAAVVVGQSAFWFGPDLQFYSYSLGGAPTPMPCPIRKDFASNISSVQADKIVASSISQFGEVRWDYPDGRDGNENSRYVAVSLAGQGWYKGVMARTAMVDAGPSTYPIGVTAAGRIYWHEKGQSDDGGSFAWRIRTADQYLSLDRTVLMRGIWPDFRDQVGPVNVTVTTRLKPQGDERTFGPYAMGVGDDKVDVRASGRLVRLELSGQSAPTYMRLGLLSVDYVPTGGR